MADVDPPHSGVGAAPYLVVSCLFELVVFHLGVLGQVVEDQVPRQGMGPLVQQRVDGYMLVEERVQANDESGMATRTRTQRGGWQNRRAHDHGHGRRAVITKPGKYLAEHWEA